MGPFFFFFFLFPPSECLALLVSRWGVMWWCGCDFQAHVLYERLTVVCVCVCCWYTEEELDEKKLVIAKLEEENARIKAEIKSETERKKAEELQRKRDADEALLQQLLANQDRQGTQDMDLEEMARQRINGGQVVIHPAPAPSIAKVKPARKKVEKHHTKRDSRPRTIDGDLKYDDSDESLDEDKAARDWLARLEMAQNSKYLNLGG